MRDISDGAGTAVLDHVKYASYGNILNETAPSAGDRFKYTAREWDAATSQYFYRARYYNSGAGRFTGQDPLGFGGGDTAASRYVMNAPTEYFDETGLLADPAGKPKVLTKNTIPPISIGTSFADPDGTTANPTMPPNNLVIPGNAVILTTTNTLPPDKDPLPINNHTNANQPILLTPVSTWPNIIAQLTNINGGDPIGRPIVLRACPRSRLVSCRDVSA